jgi:hypothetical protein
VNTHENNSTDRRQEKKERGLKQQAAPQHSQQPTETIN